MIYYVIKKKRLEGSGYWFIYDSKPTDKFPIDLAFILFQNRPFVLFNESKKIV